MIGMCNSWSICPLVGHCVFKNDDGEEVQEYGEKFCMLGNNLFVKKDQVIIDIFKKHAEKIAEKNEG